MKRRAVSARAVRRRTRALLAPLMLALLLAGAVGVGLPACDTLPPPPAEDPGTFDPDPPTEPPPEPPPDPGEPFTDADVSVAVQAVLEAGYGTPPVDGAYLGWGAPHRAPPEDLATAAYPAGGPYSSADEQVMTRQMADAVDAGIGVLVLRWWGRGSEADARLPALLTHGAAAGIRLALQIEPYPGRTPATVAADLAYLSASYGGRAALLRARRPGASADAAELPVVYLRDAAASGTAAQWRAALDGLRGVDADAVVVADGLGAAAVSEAHVDGTYLWSLPSAHTAPAGAAHAGDAAASLAAQAAAAHADGGLAVAVVAPGLDALRAVPGSAAYRNRRDGAFYDALWGAALDAGADLILVRSFNGWAEGSQLEPAEPTAAPPPTSGPSVPYLDYQGAYATAGAAAQRAYLERTRRWMEALEGRGAPPSPPPERVVVAAAGDIACDPADAAFLGGAGTAERCRQAATSDQLLAIRPDAVLALGDTQYESGEASAYQASYQPSWGRFLDRTLAAVGNHEYYASGAAGFYGYFGDAAGSPDQGWFSAELGAWHVVVLNSNCAEVGGCSAGSPQEQWLRADLRASGADAPGACTLALWHHPRFSSGTHGDETDVRALWQALTEAGAELVLSGHDHAYERLAPMDADGNATPAGVAQFVAGAGGKSHYAIVTPRPNSAAHDDTRFGVLELTLDPSGYDWAFRPEGGGAFDAGHADCR